MERHQELKNAFFQAKFLDHDFRECIEWAIREIGHTPDDMNTMILAGLEKEDYWEIKKYIEAIVGHELVDSQSNNETWTGKHILELNQKFKGGELSILKLDEILSKLYYRLDYPDWLVMLTRNCEYATDVDAFEKPFLDELQYICSLWEECSNIDEFNHRYDRKISNLHDW